MAISTRQAEEIPEHGLAYGHLATPRAVGAFVTLVVFLSLTTLAVAMRFYARTLVKGRYYLYDWMVVGALVRTALGILWYRMLKLVQFIYYGYAVAAFLCEWRHASVLANIADPAVALFLGGTGWQITELGSLEVENALKASQPLLVRR